MQGAEKIISLMNHGNANPDDHGAVGAEPCEFLELADVDTANPDWADDTDSPRVSRALLWRRRALGISATTLAFIGMGWIVLVIISTDAPFYHLPDWTVLIIKIAPGLSAPLSFLALLWLLFHPRAHAGVHQTSIDQSELRILSQVAAADIQSRLTENTDLLRGQIEQLDIAGEAALQRVATLRATLNEEIGQISVQTSLLKNAAAAARSDMAVLMSHLPKAHVETRKIVVALQDAGSTAYERTIDLAGQLEKVANQSQVAQTLAQTTVATLASHISVIDEHANAAQRQIEQSRKVLDTVQETGGAALDHRLATLMEQIDALGLALRAQDGAGEQLIEKLRVALADVEERLARIDTDGYGRLELLGSAVNALNTQSSTLYDNLQNNGTQTDQLIGKTEALLLALDSATREISESLPAAWERATVQADNASMVISGMSELSETVEKRLHAAHATTHDISENLSGHANMIGATEANLAKTRHAVQALNDAVALWELQAKSLGEEAHGTLVDTMLRVKETAEIARARASEAIQSVIPDAVKKLSMDAGNELSAVTEKIVTAQIQEVTGIAEQAVAATTTATEQLMRQLLTIRETSEMLEQQMRDVDEKQASGLQDNLSRKVALLIESLNSISIDVCGLLEQDVSDDAWAAYLRGDRGIFTRRAVRLMTQSESRAILRHYENDDSFRGHVNRYTHDFEAMMRLVLHTRDSGPLSITLLSSDMGKLYVALAQAIQRLRT
ncbi:MAG: hypothetical protein KGL21_11815 [Alphaproteobacteria bacterium]|nr:hypothetical protein [Alphaproteobacteria bacterium]